MSDDEPVDLDDHRDVVSQQATIDRRKHLRDFQIEQQALQRRQKELEKLMLAESSENWPAAAAKAEYLIRLFSDTPQAAEPRRQELIDQVLEEFNTLSNPTETNS